MAKREIVLDQFFTLPSNAERFLGILNGMYPLDGYDIVLEPSAGNGSFYNVMPNNKVGLDLEPLADGIQKMDFFDYQPPSNKRVATVGNPPFGRKGKLAKEFFNRAAEYSDVIAFVLPAIFAKGTFTNTLDPWFHKVYEEFTDEFVTPDNQEKKINCVFQIWKKFDYKRDRVTQIKEHPDFEMTHRHIAWTSQEEIDQLAQEYHFLYGQISHRVQEIEGITKGSQFFVKAKDDNVRKIFERMNFDHLKKYSMGAVSLSRGDIIEEYERIKNGKLYSE
jgi:predicted RNA methylase